MIDTAAGMRYVYMCTCAATIQGRLLFLRDILLGLILLGAPTSACRDLAGKEHVVHVYIQWSYVRGWHHIEYGSVVIPATHMPTFIIS